MTAPLNNLTDTWNNSGTVFTGLKYNITNTASAAGSLLFDFQIGGTSLFSFDKGGFGTVVNSLAANTSGDGFILTNTTAATVGNQRFSPRIRLTGQGWQTGGSTSQPTDWIIENQPVQSSSGAASNFVLSAQGNSTGYQPAMIINGPGTGNLGTFVGYQAGALVTVTDTKNTAFGYQALAAATGGGADSSNAAFGYRALVSLTTGNSNMAIGDGALFTLTTGSQNTTIGFHTMNACGTAVAGNTAIGYSCGGHIAGNYNVALGYSSLTNGSQSGDKNVAIGFTAGQSVTSGTLNVLIGDRAGNLVTSGQSNICLGSIAGASLLSGNFNVCIGESAGQSVTGDGSVCLGYRAGANETGAAKLYIANSNTTTPLIGGDFTAGSLAFTAAGGIKLGGGVMLPLATKTADYTITAADKAIIANKAGTLTLTFPSAATYPGFTVLVRTIQAQTVISASSNVVPLAGGSAGTAILAATAGKWAILQSDSTNWQIMASN